jgi:MFS family permease
MSIFTVLRNRNFLVLWSGQLFSQLADRMLVGVLLLNVHYLTSNVLAMSLPMLSFGLSALIFGSIAGVYVDRWSKKKILVWSNILRALFILGLGIFPFLSQSLVFLFIVSFIIFTIAQFFIPAESASIPTIVSKDNLMAANSFFMGTWMGATVFGFGLISFLAVLGGLEKEVIYVIAAVLYALAAVLLTFLKLKEVPVCKDHTVQSTIKDYIFGYAYTIQKRIVKYSLLKIFIAACVIAVLSELAIEFVLKVMQQDSKNFGFYVSVAGIGMGIGIVILPYLSRISKEVLSMIGFMLSGLMLILMTVTSDLYQILTLILILGIGNSLITVPIQTILQESVPRTMRGRVFGLQNVLISTAYTFPVIIAGWLADTYSVRSVFAGMGVLLLGTILLIDIRLLVSPIKLHAFWRKK